MKICDLMLQLLEHMKEYGNQEVSISIITDNGGYEFELSSVGGEHIGECHIEMEVEDVKAFKKMIK